MTASGGHRPPGRAGRRLGVDVGSVRVGVAVSDPSGSLALPLETVPRSARKGTDLARLADLVRQYEAVEVVVGLPRQLSGATGASARAAQDYADRLGRRIAPVPVRLVDERLSTVAATRGLRESGLTARARRTVVDQAAAAYILQGWLDGSATDDDDTDGNSDGG